MVVISGGVSQSHCKPSPHQQLLLSETGLSMVSFNDAARLKPATTKASASKIPSLCGFQSFWELGASVTSVGNNFKTEQCCFFYSASSSLAFLLLKFYFSIIKAVDMQHQVDSFTAVESIPIFWTYLVSYRFDLIGLGRSYGSWLPFQQGNIHHDFCPDSPKVVQVNHKNGHKDSLFSALL